MTKRKAIESSIDRVHPDSARKAAATDASTHCYPSLASIRTKPAAYHAELAATLQRFLSPMVIAGALIGNAPAQQTPSNADTPSHGFMSPDDQPPPVPGGIRPVPPPPPPPPPAPPPHRPRNPGPVES
ncbi:MAG: hypothetical protein IPK60_09615 [Sandaracinaceae bacterium]|nr:hypothetical protein [Sandaracinaceae bacterium]